MPSTDDNNDKRENDDPTCDLCPRPAVVHATEINHGVSTHRHLCAHHAAEAPELAGIKPCLSMMANPTAPLSIELQAMSSVAANLRGTANFIRRHGRMPATAAELEEGMALTPPFPTTDVTDPNLRTYLHESDALLEFYDTFGRLPPPSDDTPPAQ
jgi:hypothetical protein